MPPRSPSALASIRRVSTPTTTYQTALPELLGRIFRWSETAAKWLVPTMKNITGIENSVLVREASRPRRAAPAAAGSASPPPITFWADAMAIFWLGQITSQTLRNMTVASRAPAKMLMPGSVLK